MVSESPDLDPAPLPAVRRMLVGVLLLGMVGTTTELLLLGHYESPWQWAPLVLLAAGFALVGSQLRGTTSAGLRARQFVMALYVLAGVLGMGLHYTGNSEFEREMYPTLGGLALVGGALTGATPVLAPGSMTLLGLIGLVSTYRHPLFSGGANTEPTSSLEELR